MRNLLPLAMSMAYILIVLGAATLVARCSKGATESSRKLVHILVGNWVFLTPLFQDLWAVVLVPFTFIIVNSLSLKFNLIPAMERSDDSLGTVYYAISLFFLSGAGFILGWRLLPYIGILTMAYGDGLAAVVGQKWGRRKPFPFAPDKSLAGSLTVGAAAFLATAGSILFLRQGPAGQERQLPVILAIAFITAVIAMFIELTGRRGCDNLTLPIGTGLVATLSVHYGSAGYFLYLGLAVAILGLAYRLKSITPDGMVAALLTAVTLYALGGPLLGASLLVFFILGSAVSKVNNESKSLAEAIQESTGTRNWLQVLSNSLPAVVLVWLDHLIPGQSFFLLLAFSVFSAAAADTFSSEIGMLTKGRVFHILTGRTVPNGVSGGVSLMGLAGGVAGSILLSLLVIPQFGVFGLIFAATLGFLGSILDSLLGASIQRKYKGLQGQLQDRSLTLNEVPASGYRIISNNAVNLITLSLIPVLGFAAFRLFSIALPF